jgi:hypothetical protein
VPPDDGAEVVFDLVDVVEVDEILEVIVVLGTLKGRDVEDGIVDVFEVKALLVELEDPIN